MPGPGAARRYAEAAFELAEQAGTIDGWQRDLRAAAELAADERVALVADSPATPFDERRRMLERLLGPPMSREALNLALLLASRSRFRVLPQVSARFDDLVREARGIVAATVTSAAPLDAAELDAVKARVAEIAAGQGATPQIEMTTNVDPSLIGGVTVRIGDRLIDASVRGRLERLRERLNQGVA